MEEGNYDIERIGDRLAETNKELVAIKDALRDIADKMSSGLDIASINFNDINVSVKEEEGE